MSLSTECAAALLSFRYASNNRELKSWFSIATHGTSANILIGFFHRQNGLDVGISISTNISKGIKLK